jgi:predicted RNase H-like HicB family nuclease
MMTKLRYTVSLLRTDEGFSLWVPGLPGFASQGQTEAEALDNIRDAIDEYLSVVDELGGDAEKREVLLQLESAADPVPTRWQSLYPPPD